MFVPKTVKLVIQFWGSFPYVKKRPTLKTVEPKNLFS